MRRLTARLLTASLTFLIGIAAASAWPPRRHLPVASDQTTPAPPCREGLISATPRPGAPLRIYVLAATCQGQQTPLVRFRVENVSTQPITSYSVFLFAVHEGRGRVYGSGVGPNGVNIQPRQGVVESVGGNGLLYGPDGLPVPGLEGYELAVCSVKFADGTTWGGDRLCG